MRPTLDWTTWAGFLAVLALLALSSPGVRVARAAADADAATSLATEAATCDAFDPGPTVSVELVIDRDRLATPGEPDLASDRTIVLNTSGYNYRPAPRVDRTLDRPGS